MSERRNRNVAIVMKILLVLRCGAGEILPPTDTVGFFGMNEVWNLVSIILFKYSRNQETVSVNKSLFNFSEPSKRSTDCNSEFWTSFSEFFSGQWSM